MDDSIHRVPECLSLHRNWVPHPLPRKRVCLPPWTQRWESNTRLRVRGGAYSDDRTESMALCKLCALGFATVCKDDN